MDEIELDGAVFSGFRIPTPNGTLLLITAPNGLLGCGYFACETADKLGDALAVVTGVKNYDDMLSAKVCRISAAAAAAGIETGMTGREALLLMK